MLNNFLTDLKNLVECESPTDDLVACQKVIETAAKIVENRTTSDHLWQPFATRLFLLVKLMTVFLILMAHGGGIAVIGRVGPAKILWILATIGMLGGIRKVWGLIPGMKVASHFIGQRLLPLQL